VQQEEGGADHEGEHGGGGDVAVRGSEDVAEEQLLDAGRRFGREREQDAEPEHRRDDDSHRNLTAEAGDAGDDRDRQRRDDDRRGAAEQQRRARDRGQDQAGEDRVRQRLGRVGEPVEDDPAAERAAGDADQRHLGDRAPHEFVLQGLEHRQWW
jgi:hypothetical protein